MRSYISFNNQKITKVFLKFILYCTVRLISISLIFEFDTLEYVHTLIHRFSSGTIEAKYLDNPSGSGRRAEVRQMPAI